MTQKGKGGRSPKDPIGSVKISIHTNSWTSFTLMPEDGQQCELHGSLYSLISSSTCDPQAQPRHMMLLIYLMSRGGKKHTKSGVRIWNWGVVEIFYGNKVTGGHAHQLAVLLGSQILRVSVFPGATTFKETFFSSLFYHCLGKTEIIFVSFFMSFFQRILWLSKEACPMLEVGINSLTWHWRALLILLFWASDWERSKYSVSSVMLSFCHFCDIRVELSTATCFCSPSFRHHR